MRRPPWKCYPLFSPVFFVRTYAVLCFSLHSVCQSDPPPPTYQLLLHQNGQLFLRQITIDILVIRPLPSHAHCSTRIAGNPTTTPTRLQTITQMLITKCRGNGQRVIPTATAAAARRRVAIVQTVHVGAAQRWVIAI
jgi:hypothetical protein